MNAGMRAALLLIACFVADMAQATTRRVLFIGNSYIYSNNMPLMLQNMATALGDTLIYDESDPGGYTFEMHSTYAPTITKIFAQPWDVVVLQEQSQRPSFPPAQVATDVYPYAHILDSLINANDTCSQTMFLMTWGRANGDAMNCPSYPMVCTYAGMQMRLRESYMQMTQDNDAVVAPVGVAWKAVKDSFPAIGLYQADSSHPSLDGSYLEAAVMYASIFHKPTYGCTYSAGLATTTVQTLQRITDRVVFDSLSHYQQYGHYPAAIFTHTVSGSTVSFTGKSPVPADDYWLFGDGGSDTASNPAHTYTATGSYVVKHTITTACFTETITTTVHVGTLSVNDAASTPIMTVRQQGNGIVTFDVGSGLTGYTLELYDISGRAVRRYVLDGKNITDVFVPGFYCYNLYAPGKGRVQTGKVAVY